MTLVSQEHTTSFTTIKISLDNFITSVISLPLLLLILPVLPVLIVLLIVLIVLILLIPTLLSAFLRQSLIARLITNVLPLCLLSQLLLLFPITTFSKPLLTNSNADPMSATPSPPRSPKSPV